MITISVRESLQTVRSASSQLSENQFNKAISRSLNETIMQGRTEARSAVKGIYNIPQRYLSGINVNKANSKSLVASLYASAKPIPMDAFGAKFQTATKSLSITRKGEQKERTFKRARKNPNIGVTIEVFKGKSETIPFAFMLSNGKPRVFARGEYKSGASYGFTQRNKRIQKQGSDTPIKPLVSVTVHAAVINKDALSKIEGKVNTVFPRIIEHNISRMISQIEA